MNEPRARLPLDATERAVLAHWRSIQGTPEAQTILLEGRVSAPATRLDPAPDLRAKRLDADERAALAEWRRRRDDVRAQTFGEAMLLHRFENQGEGQPNAAVSLAKTLRPEQPSVFQRTWSTPRRIPVHAVGLLLGGAVGNAFGATRLRGGTWAGEGLSGTTAAFRLSCFLAEALLRAHARLRRSGVDAVSEEIGHALSVWRAFEDGAEPPLDARNVSWLARELPRSSADGPSASTPGGASALVSHATLSFWWGGLGATPAESDQAPLADLVTGMVLRGGGDSPSAVSAAALATLLRESMFDAPELALSEAERHVAALPEGSLVAGALRRVRELRDGCRAGNATHRDAVAELGGFGEVVGALAIGVFAALTSSSWQEALSLATDWDGDVAGAGAICGFVKGVQEGPGRIGEDLVGSLDVGEQVLRLGLDAAEEFGSMPANSPEWFARYPVLPKHRTTGAGAPREGGQTAGRTTRGTEQSTVGTSDVNMNAVERAIADFAAEEAPVSRVYEEFLRTPMLLVTSPESSDPVFFHIKDQEKEQIWVCTRAEAVPDFAPGTRVAIGYQLLPLLGGRNVHIATPGDQNDLMLIGERAVLHSLPELTDEFREEARRHPGSWLPVPDVMFRSSPGAELGEHAFVGQFWVDESGELSGDYRPNPTYMPSPVTLGFPEPASPLERALHLKYTGYASESELASVVARTEFALVVDEDGSVPTTTSSGEDRPVAIAASAAKYVPDIGKNAVRVRAESLRSLLQEVDLVFDAGTAHQVRLPGAALIDALDAGPESEGAEPAREAQPQQAGAPSPQPQPQPQPPRPEPNAHERFLGSMLAGAMGDALGYAIEFNDIEMIRRHHGPAGVTGPVLRDGLAHISDDTQMMLFTLEGLIRAHVARRIKPVDSDPVPEVQHAYQRWYHTQNQPWERAAGPYARHLAQPDGWLITNRELFSPRAPGNTCMSALANFAQTHQHATPRHRINDSKGCGGVMRAAPVAVWSNDPAEVFKAAVDTAALTHSHPSGFLSAGVLAVVVHQLIRSVPLADSVRVARDLLVRWPEHEEQLRALDAAVDLGARGPVSPEELKQTLGEGWVGEEALAIGLYAVMATGDLPSALLLSVNHSGDSDSTGIVCGNIAGAIYGNQAIPPEWLEKLELHDVIHTLARDALAEFSPGPPTDPAWSRRYPAW